MVTIDFSKVTETFIDKGVNITNLENNGFVLNNNMLCDYNTLNILRHTQYVYCKELLTEEQSEKVIELYNKLMN